MKWYHYLIVIVITVIVVFVVQQWRPCKPCPPVGTKDVVDVPAARGAYHEWLFIDEIGGKPQLAAIDGSQLMKLVVTYKNDELIFVNRMDVKVTVSFTSNAIFGAPNSEFDIEPYKRAVRKVIGPPAEYSFNLDAGTGIISPPKVKVGEEP